MQLKVCKVFDLVQKPAVDFGDIVDLVHGHAGFERLEHREQAVIVLRGEPLAHRRVG